MHANEALLHTPATHLASLPCSAGPRGYSVSGLPGEHVEAAKPQLRPEWPAHTAGLQTPGYSSRRPAPCAHVIARHPCPPSHPRSFHAAEGLSVRLDWCERRCTGVREGRSASTHRQTDRRQCTSAQFRGKAARDRKPLQPLPGHLGPSRPDDETVTGRVPLHRRKANPDARYPAGICFCPIPMTTRMAFRGKDDCPFRRLGRPRKANPSCLCHTWPRTKGPLDHTRCACAPY